MPSVVVYSRPDRTSLSERVGINSDGRFMMEDGMLSVTNQPGAPILANEFLFGLGDVEAVSFILLHELGHRRKIFGANDNDGDGKGDDDAETDRNDEKIYDACFRE